MAAPPSPAAFQPISAASMDPGPGAARDNAKRSANSRSLVQPCTWIACCAMSAMTPLPPPNDKSDSGAKTRPSAISVPPEPRMSALPRLQPGEADAERSEAEHDRDHRPAQYADAQHCRCRDRRRRQAGGSLRNAAQPGREGQPDHGGGDTVEHVVQCFVACQSRIDTCDPEHDQERAGEECKQGNRRPGGAAPMLANQHG